MLDSLRLHRKLWHFTSFFSREREDAIGTAKAIEQYLKEREIKFSSAMSTKLINYLLMPNRSEKKIFTKSRALLTFITVFKQYNQLLLRIDSLRKLEEINKFIFLPDLSYIINSVSLLDALLTKEFSAIDLVRQDQLPLFDKTIALLTKVSGNLKRLQQIDKEMQISEDGLFSLIKSTELAISVSQSIEENPPRYSTSIEKK